jgi:hypothetical protein
MKRKIWIALVVLAIVIGVTWAPLSSGPSIRFLGYSKSGDDVIAQFEMTNPTSRDLTFRGRSSRPYCDYISLDGGSWKRFNYRWEPGTNAYAEGWHDSDESGYQILPAHKSIKFDQDVIFPVAFQVGVELMHIDAAAAPHRPVSSGNVRIFIASIFGREIIRRITWSEIVPPPPP